MLIKRKIMKKFFKMVSLGVSVIMSLVIFIPVINAAESISPRAVSMEETESNNTFTTANTIFNDYTISGKISSINDVDYYEITFTDTGYANFWLGNIPLGLDYDMEIYDFDETCVEVANSTGSYELITNWSVTAGEKYYIKINGFGNSYSTTQEYLLRVRFYYNNYTYYSQKPVNITYTNMDNLYNAGYEGNGKSWYNRLYDAGCAVCSYAMVLKNMGVNTIRSGKDVRNATSPSQITPTYMSADPYSVIWASNGCPNITYNSAKEKYIAQTAAQDPINTYLGNIAAAFGVNYSRWDVNNKSETEKKQMIAKLISLYPQGICLYFNKNGSTHMIVLTSTTYSVPSTFELPPSTYSSNNSRDSIETNSNDVFVECDYCSDITESDVIAYQEWLMSAVTSAFDDTYSYTVYDPVNTTTHPGQAVELTESYTGSVYSWDYLSSIRVFYE